MLQSLVIGLRITPACAGRSSFRFRGLRCGEDHPRVCGEKAFLALNTESPPGITPACAGRSRRALPRSHRRAGSPPRVRGEAFNQGEIEFSNRITPACAGRSTSVTRPAGTTLDHPRVCGEKPRTAQVSRYTRGSPPRVRGEAENTVFEEPEAGITPACAGRSRRRHPCRFGGKDHPRVCGEKSRL